MMAMPRPRSRASSSVVSRALSGVTHPGELERRRIVRALEGRARYRYVMPQLQAEPGGFRIVSPCCSRNVDPNGGTIDIARLEYVKHDDRPIAAWRLYSKNHVTLEWVSQAEGPLHELLDLLTADPDRVFWQ